MTSHRILRFVRAAGVAIATAAALLSGPAPAASAEPCSDIEVVFARGTSEPPGVGGVGQAFVDALRARVGDRSLAVYPVNYPASSDFTAGIEFAATVVEGIRDAANHVQATAANCPTTKIVLGGFSQGAAVAGFTTSAAVPEGVPAAFVPPPMPPEVANHVAAVVLFGKPSDQWLRDAGAPTIVLGPTYVPKTIDLCADGDTICNGAPLGGPTLAHASYGFNGMVNQAADFAVSRL
ncbi:cutinase [Mycobacterium sp. ACS1612]|uniref:cutinase family protein n=1 Tax=Mycobacterium sp. ACS1612 TaxID=1834117 RepID=UPI00080094B2|nr:cutinase family protein [Mycobacterium sp. ACS1612]OBF41052.1 cutinase [Mycobacterium sp. ACS1612]